MRGDKVLQQRAGSIGGLHFSEQQIPVPAVPLLPSGVPPRPLSASGQQHARAGLAAALQPAAHACPPLPPCACTGALPRPLPALGRLRAVLAHHRGFRGAPGHPPLPGAAPHALGGAGGAVKQVGALGGGSWLAGWGWFGEAGLHLICTATGVAAKQQVLCLGGTRDTARTCSMQRTLPAGAPPPAACWR